MLFTESTEYGRVFRPDLKKDEIHAREDENNLYLYCYINEKPITLERPKTDTLDRLLTRILKKFTEARKERKKKKEKSIAFDDVGGHTLITIEFGNETIDTTNMLVEQLREGMVICFDDIRLRFMKDVPVVLTINVFPKKNMAIGYPSVAVCKYEFCDELSYAWCIEMHDEFVVVSENSIYTPLIHHLGFRVKLYCIPWKYQLNNADTTEKKVFGRPLICYCKEVTSPLVTVPFILNLRSGYIAKKLLSSYKTNKSIRIVSYNILAESYATSEHAKNNIYPYVDPSLLELEYRCPLILKELDSYLADIICLQECDKKTFELYFHPYLNTQNYIGYYTEKSGRVPEGCAILINNSTFISRMHFDISLKHALESDPRLATLFMLRPDIYQILCLNLGTVCQLEVLQHRIFTNQIIIVGNTHLFYHPSAAYIRLLHIYAIMKTIMEIKNAIILTNGFDFTLDHFNPASTHTNHDHNTSDSNSSNSNNNAMVTEKSSTDTPVAKVEPIEYKISVIFAGDLNSTPETGVIEYLNRYCAPPHSCFDSVL